LRVIWPENAALTRGLTRTAACFATLQAKTAKTTDNWLKDHVFEFAN
jgi:hypothetical protein